MQNTTITTVNSYYNINRNYLEDLIIHLFEVKTPESVDPRYFISELLLNGFIGVYKVGKRVVCSSGTLSGIGEYYKPINFTNTVPFFPSKQYTIHKNCEIIYNSDDYRNPRKHGLNELIDVYARRLSENDLSIDTSILNSRVVLLPVVGDPADAERTREILNKMRAGESAVLSYKTSLANKNYELLPIKARDNIVTAELNDTRRNILNSFLDMLGVNNISVDKKERTNLDEMESNAEKLKLSLDRMILPIKEGVARVNTRFGGGFSVELKDYLKGGERDVVETPSGDNRQD